MSKPVRIREFVATPIARLAEAESRPFANMVEVLLLAALTERGGTVGGNAGRADRGSYEAVASADAGVLKTAPSRSVSPADVAATIPGVTAGASTTARGCPADTPRGTKCKLCGKVH